jgi:hypothetical protein
MSFRIDYGIVSYVSVTFPAKVTDLRKPTSPSAAQKSHWKFNQYFHTKQFKICEFCHISGADFQATVISINGHAGSLCLENAGWNTQKLQKIKWLEMFTWHSTS